MATPRIRTGITPARQSHRFNQPARNAVDNVNLQRLITARTQRGKTAPGAPQFPGYNTGAGIAAIRKLIQEQPRCSGFPFVAGAATQTNINNIQLPGDARIFLGLIFTTFAATGDTFTLSINNNVIIQNGSCQLHAMNNSASITELYFPYPQPLTGTDKIEIVVTSIAGQSGVLQLHFI